jgi:hypothetical protein
VSRRRTIREQLREAAVYFGLAEPATEVGGEPTRPRRRLTGWRELGFEATFGVILLIAAALDSPAAVVVVAGVLAIAIAIRSPLGDPLRRRWPQLDDSLYSPVLAGGSGAIFADGPWWHFVVFLVVGFVAMYLVAGALRRFEPVPRPKPDEPETAHVATGTPLSDQDR